MSANQTQTISSGNVVSMLAARASTVPLRRNNLMDQYTHLAVTPGMGEEFSGELQLSELLKAPNADTLIQDLAVLISERGVAFFRGQDLSAEDMKVLGQKLGKLSGKPAESGLHIHHLTEENSPKGDQVHIVTSTRRVDRYRGDSSRLHSLKWHSDSCYEPVPSDYTLLKIHTLPASGGDTLWANGYEVYSRLSPPLARMLEGLNALHDVRSHYTKAGEDFGNTLRTGERGHPLNTGQDLCAIHPVIRVTGWKAVFVNKGVTKRIIGLSKDESDAILDYLNKLFLENHDLQLRFKWNVDNGEGLLADDPLPTSDYEDQLRVGDRVVGVGEKPYYDPNAKDRRRALGLPGFFDDN
ncbi:hypothetical protein JCM24511_05286 [Saitozyma sp. JCM 24511]|nr:hypothetical protein JCM24511_05286 [Saitozyma sp. JCM 24511]